eukprot:TRINITY_DN9799_c1_g1_i1.p1 TRINITY_DN9799_c1_g1~~TRINITY_DN9799_c1_g1_i1.p1  ORF type:complete len:1031 (+),score=212.70 TRINITY_DN9799_c1_g1_i1:68-3094(+)
MSDVKNTQNPNDGSSEASLKNGPDYDDMMDERERKAIASRERFFKGFVITEGLSTLASITMLGLWITFWVEWTDQICGRADGLFKSVYFLHWWFIVFNFFVSLKHLAIGVIPDRLYSKHAIYILLPLSVDIFQLIFMMPSLHTAYFKLDCFDDDRKRTMVLWLLILSGVCIVCQAMLLLWVGLADAPNMNLNKNLHRPEQAFEIPGMPSFRSIEEKGTASAVRYSEEIVHLYRDALSCRSTAAALRNVLELQIPGLYLQQYAADPETPIYEAPMLYPEPLQTSIEQSVELAFRSQVEGLQYFSAARVKEILVTCLHWVQYMEQAGIPTEVVVGYRTGLADVVSSAFSFVDISMTNPLTSHVLNHLAASIRSRLCHLASRICRNPDHDMKEAFKKIVYEIEATQAKFVSMYRRRQAAPDWADGNQAARNKAIEFKASLEGYLFDVSLSNAEAEYVTQFTYLHAKYVHMLAGKTASVAAKCIWKELIDSDEAVKTAKNALKSNSIDDRVTSVIETAIEEAVAESEEMGNSLGDSSINNSSGKSEPLYIPNEDVAPGDRLAADLASRLAKQIESGIQTVLSTLDIASHVRSLREPAHHEQAAEFNTIINRITLSTHNLNVQGLYLTILYESAPSDLAAMLPNATINESIVTSIPDEAVKGPETWAVRNQTLAMIDVVKGSPEMFQRKCERSNDPSVEEKLRKIKENTSLMMLVDILAIEKSFTLDGYGKIRKSSKRLRKGLRVIDKSIPPKWYDKNAIGLLAVVGGANMEFGANFDALTKPPVNSLVDNMGELADLVTSFDTKVAKLINNMDEAMDEALHQLSNIDECLNNASNPLMLIAGVLRAFPFMTKGFALAAATAILAVSLVAFVSFMKWYTMIQGKYQSSEESERFVNTYGVMVWIQLFQVLQCIVMVFVVLIGGNKLEYHLSFKVLIAVVMMMSTAQMNVSSVFSFSLSQKYETVLNLGNQTDEYCSAKYAFQACSPSRSALIAGRVSPTETLVGMLANATMEL